MAFAGEVNPVATASRGSLLSGEAAGGGRKEMGLKARVTWVESWVWPLL